MLEVQYIILRYTVQSVQNQERHLQMTDAMQALFKGHADNMSSAELDVSTCGHD